MPGRVFVVRSDSENLAQLDEIRRAQEAGRRVFDEFSANPAHFGYDVIGPEAIALYYRYYFFERREDMVYQLDPVAAKRLGRSSETLLNLLSSNTAAAQDLGPENGTLLLRQSFMAAGSNFQAIDAPTEGIVVPFGTEGARLIDQLLDSDHDPRRQHELVRRAQRYTVSVYPDTIRKLKEARAIKEISATARIHLLVDDRYYSPRMGLTTEMDDEWRFESMVVGGGG
jgi:CRISPR-associated endonuclease/helicase Cas3